MKKKFKCMIIFSLLIAVLSFAGCSNVLDESAEKEHLHLTEDTSNSEMISSPALDDDTNLDDSLVTSESKVHTEATPSQPPISSDKNNPSETVSESITPSGADSSIQPDATRENDKSGTSLTGASQSDIAEDNIITKIFESATLCLGNPIDNPEMASVMTELITEENKFINNLDTAWPSEKTEQIEYDERTYLLIGEISWAEYESTAKNFYSDNYITNVFTPQYLTNSSLFIELDGKLYRAMADGIGMSVIKDSVSIWEVASELYYVTILLDTEVPGVRSFIIKDSPDKMYGYEILNKRHNW